MGVSITYDYNNAMASTIGPGHGVTESMLYKIEPKARKVDRWLRDLRRRRVVGFYSLANTRRRAAELDEIAAVGQSISKRFANFVILGIGGSALGSNGTPRVFVLDNVDPELLAGITDVVDPAETCFNVITKSGNTPETVSQFMGLYERVAAKVGERRASKHFVVTTSRRRRPLRRVAEQLGMRCFWIPKNVGGRFSELSVVGLLPAAVANVDIHGMISGAQAVAKACDSPDFLKNPAYLNGAIHYLAERFRHKTISVLMPYSEALAELADWYRQLWAESLGKRRGKPPNEVSLGQTPVGARGTTDQHSQLQLYLEGPNDKIITLIGVEQFRRQFAIGTRLGERLPELASLAGRNIGDLLRAEMDATEFTLARAERPSVRITLGKIDAEHLGGLLFFFMVQTGFTGGLYGVNPFNQPGVQEGKDAAWALMGRGLPTDVRMMRQIEAYRSRRNHHPPLRISS
ncbi:hypothetical protein AMJ85_09570 [candidate division BRC1 bacterium SM23_51]|nr:MAG: hypothetical protein AMJ85_09570 [candidate division BRC1 bacterium SM23_51]